MRLISIFFLEIFFSGISCLVETSQLISVCEFAFVLMDFLQREFSNQIKNDLFVVFHNPLEFSKKISGNTYKEAHFP